MSRDDAASRGLGEGPNSPDDHFASIGARLAPLCAVTVAVAAQVLMRDRIVLGPLFLAPVTEVVLVVTLLLGDGVFRIHRRRLARVRYALALVLAISATTSA